MFQSSPGPKTGCYVRYPPVPNLIINAVSILTRPEDRVLRYQAHDAFRDVAVSILTRPEDRVLQFHAEGRLLGLQIVSILTRPEDRVLPTTVVHHGHGRSNMVSILTRPKNRVLRPDPRAAPGPSRVSILTRPEGRVLNGDRLQRRGELTDVSILTRPEDRVQPAIESCPVARMTFQSSPGPKTGCIQRPRYP